MPTERDGGSVPAEMTFARVVFSGWSLLATGAFWLAFSIKQKPGYEPRDQRTRESIHQSAGSIQFSIPRHSTFFLKEDWDHTIGAGRLGVVSPDRDAFEVLSRGLALTGRPDAIHEEVIATSCYIGVKDWLIQRKFE